ncbi:MULTISPECIES: nucleotide sugar dehydrogenase [unclassified Methanoculleus]|uniref:nucleotide sugar dehydrogenase n=1 Tax=unclassified Methanoculleus TaxID=2619537 RepID=UPI0025EFDB5F|nr:MULTISPECIES: nucleotide sugar dehydrogenase [unclassified Methanoculleus]
MQNLLVKITDRSAKIGIIGQGYVGLPLAMAFARKFTVFGYDVCSGTVERLRAGKSHIQDVLDTQLSLYLGHTYFPTSEPEDLHQCDFLIICVPTPLSEDKIPDLGCIKDACSTLKIILRRGQFVILESTTFPGTTDEVVVPILEETGFVAGSDFGIAYSPERVDPGNKQYPIDKVPTVVGGINVECTNVAAALYGSIMDRVVPVRDARTAEAVKMIENIFRNVNIALVNEMALIFERMGIDTWEVIDAAATKPYGFMPFYPGPGIGGHCIPLDPYYMSYQAKKYGFIPRFIETSGEINEFMKVHTVNLIEKGLRQVGKRVYGAKVAVMGLAYKKNINDSRESPSIKIVEELANLGADVRVYDPFVPSLATKAGVFTSAENIEEALSGADCAAFLVDHDAFRRLDAGYIGSCMSTPVLVDCKNLFQQKDGIVYLCIGKGE